MGLNYMLFFVILQSILK